MRRTWATMGAVSVMALAIPVTGIGSGSGPAQLPKRVGKGEGSLVLLQWPGYSHAELRGGLRAGDRLQDHTSGRRPPRPTWSSS